jgi:hypothetical protein
MVIVWVAEIQNLEKVKNAKRSKNFGNSCFCVLKYRFLLKKNSKSGRRGGADFGTHV